MKIMRSWLGSRKFDFWLRQSDIAQHCDRWRWHCATLRISQLEWSGGGGAEETGFNTAPRSVRSSAQLTSDLLAAHADTLASARNSDAPVRRRRRVQQVVLSPAET